LTVHDFDIRLYRTMKSRLKSEGCTELTFRSDTRSNNFTNPNIEQVSLVPRL